MEKETNRVINGRYCSVCGGSKGFIGTRGLPGQPGREGSLGPCSHEESRGRRGSPGYPIGEDGKVIVPERGTTVFSLW